MVEKVATRHFRDIERVLGSVVHGDESERIKKLEERIRMLEEELKNRNLGLGKSISEHTHDVPGVGPQLTSQGEKSSAAVDTTSKGVPPPPPPPMPGSGVIPSAPPAPPLSGLVAPQLPGGGLTSAAKKLHLVDVFKSREEFLQYQQLLAASQLTGKATDQLTGDDRHALADNAKTRLEEFKKNIAQMILAEARAISVEESEKKQDKEIIEWGRELIMHEQKMYGGDLLTEEQKKLLGTLLFSERKEYEKLKIQGIEGRSEIDHKKAMAQYIAMQYFADFMSIDGDNDSDIGDLNRLKSYFQEKYPNIDQKILYDVHDFIKTFRIKWATRYEKVKQKNTLVRDLDLKSVFQDQASFDEFVSLLKKSAPSKDDLQVIEETMQKVPRICESQGAKSKGEELCVTQQFKTYIKYLQLSQERGIVESRRLDFENASAIKEELEILGYLNIESLFGLGRDNSVKTQISTVEKNIKALLKGQYEKGSEIAYSTVFPADNSDFALKQFIRLLEKQHKKEEVLSESESKELALKLGQWARVKESDKSQKPNLVYYIKYLNKEQPNTTISESATEDASDEKQMLEEILLKADEGSRINLLKKQPKSVVKQETNVTGDGAEVIVIADRDKEGIGVKLNALLKLEKQKSLDALKTIKDFQGFMDSNSDREWTLLSAAVNKLSQDCLREQLKLSQGQNVLSAVKVLADDKIKALIEDCEVEQLKQDEIQGLKRAVYSDVLAFKKNETEADKNLMLRFFEREREKVLQKSAEKGQRESLQGGENKDGDSGVTSNNPWKRLKDVFKPKNKENDAGALVVGEKRDHNANLMSEVEDFDRGRLRKTEQPPAREESDGGTIIEEDASELAAAGTDGGAMVDA